MKNWRIIISTCLVIAICLATASAAIESPLTKNSFDKSSATAFADARASAMENMKTGFEKPVFNPPDPIEKPEFPDVPEKPTVPEITLPAFNPLPAPTSRVPDPINRDLSAPKGIMDITIFQDEAKAIALARFPGISLVEPIRATLKRINAPGFPLAVNPCWVVYVNGHNADPSTWPPSWMCYGGQVIIDAVTGEVLYVDIFL